MEEIGRMFESKGLDVLSLREEKLKGKGEGGVCLMVREELDCDKMERSVVKTDMDEDDFGV